MYIMSNKIRIRTAPLLLIAALLSFPPGHCPAALAQTREKAAPLYEDALARYERKDLDGALIQLKNALQQDPRLLQAHLLSGRILLELGRTHEAELAFNTALDLGIAPGEVFPLLGQAMLQQGKQRALLERLDPGRLPASARTEVLVIRAYAQMDLNDLRAAERTLEEAARTDGRAVSVPIAATTLALRRGDLPRARSHAALAVSLGPREAKAWNARATVAHASGDAKGALADYGQALALNPDFSEARLARAALLLDLGRDQEAAADLALLRKAAATDPRVNYLRAQHLSRSGDSAGARAALAESGAAVDTLPAAALERKPQYLLIGGVAYASLGQQEKAKSYLQRFVQANPSDLPARRLLGSIYLAEKDYLRTVGMLEPVLKAAPRDAYAMSMLASAYMGLNRPQSATEMLQRALQSGDMEASTRAFLGFTLLGTGQTDAAVEHLRRAFKADPRQVRVATALVVLDLKRGDTKAALQSVELLLEHEGDNPVVQNLAGVARAAAGDRNGARAAYERALTLDGQMRPARLNLAKLDAAEGRFEPARAALTALLKGNPNDQQALLELAQLERRAGRLEDARRWYEKVLAVNSRHFQAGIELTDLLIDSRRPDQALAVAKSIESRAPERLDVLAALARAHIANGEFQNARGIFERMSRFATLDSTQQLQLARYYVMAGDRRGARLNIEKILAAEPNHLGAETMLLELDLADGDLAQAETRARAIKARPGSTALGHRLLGDVAMAQAKYAAAVAEYEAALSRAPNPDTLIRLAVALQHAGQAGRAIQLLERARIDHPGNDLVERALAELHLRTGNWAGARAVYEPLLKRLPNDVGILNNLAYALFRQNDPAALNFAERAYRLAPRDANVNDTLGWLLVQAGQLEQGLRYLREARLRDPQNPEIRYHLAYALAKAGRRGEARAELDAALRAERPFEQRDAARRLAQELSGV